MAVNPMLRSNPIRMMGMASGMDTDSIIQATLRMHQFKIENQMRNRQLIEWKQQYHNDIKSQITNLRNDYLRSLGSKTMMSRNTYNTNLATAMSGGKVSSAVTVSATSTSSLGSMTIKSVNSLAKGASLTTAGDVSFDGKGFSTSATLGSLQFAGGNQLGFGADKATLTTVDGKKVDVNRSDIEGSAVSWVGTSSISITNGNSVYTLNLIKSADGLSYSYTGSYVADITDPEGSPEILGGPVALTGDSGKITLEDGTEINLEFTGDTFSYSMDDGDGGYITGTGGFSYTGTLTTTEGNVQLNKDAEGNITNSNGNAINYFGETSLNIAVNGGTAVNVTLTSNMTINEMIAKVNKEASGVTMTYDRLNDKFVIESKTINGAATSLSVTGGAAGLLFGGAEVQKGSLTEIIVDDGTAAGKTVTSTTNTIDYRGISIKVNHTTDEEINVTVTRDTDKAVNAIKEFIDSYNVIIKKIEDLLNDRKSGKEVGYTPLTDEEKASMTEKQVEEWEAIAKKGILRSDRGLQDLASKLRSEFFKEIEGTGLSASQIGLSTGNYFGGTGGQILIDEDKLRAALQEDPDKVADVFIKIGADANGNSVGQGLMYKLDKVLSDYVGIGGTQATTLDALEKSYKELNDRIAKLEERMWAEEDKLYRQFAAMETAMSKMQQQGDWFTAMLGGK